MERVELHCGDVVGGCYRIEKALGEGTFGQVFKVKNRNGGTEALKILKMWCISPDERDNVAKRFDMEYRTGRINSPYLVHSLNKGEHRGNPYIVMEYCDGGDLLHALNRGMVDTTRAMTQVLLGLDALHREGKVHRDLKPENVLIRHDGTSVLTDFGISGDQNHRLTRRGIFGTPREIMGTFIYMPPEQVRPPSGNATVRPTTDIFSFGVMLYQILTSQLPFGKLESDDDMERYCENGRTGRWNRDLLRRHPQSSTWMPVVEGCLQPNYTRRLQSVSDVLRLMPHVPDIPIAQTISTAHQTTAGSPSQWCLRVMQGEELGRRYPLDPAKTHSGVLHMGRHSASAHNDIPLKETLSAYISRSHCTLEYDAGEQRWYLWDGQWVEQTGGGKWKPSLNGTFVGSRQVTMDDPYPLSTGDIITLGDVTLRVEAQ